MSKCHYGKEPGFSDNITFCYTDDTCTSAALSINLPISYDVPLPCVEVKCQAHWTPTQNEHGILSTQAGIGIDGKTMTDEEVKEQIDKNRSFLDPWFLFLQMIDPDLFPTLLSEKRWDFKDGPSYQVYEPVKVPLRMCTDGTLELVITATYVDAPEQSSSQSSPGSKVLKVLSRLSQLGRRDGESGSGSQSHR